MRKKIVLLMLLCAMSMLPLSAAGPNPAMKKEYDFKNFNAIKTTPKSRSISGRGTFVFSSYHITLVKSDQYKVEMKVWDRDAIDMFEIRQNGEVLELVTDYKKYPYHSSKKDDPYADVIIYTPKLVSVSLTGANSLSVSGGEFSGNTLMLDLNSASKMSGLSGTWNNINIKMTGASKVIDLDLTGKTCKMDCDGAADVKGRSSLKVDKLSLLMTGATSATFDNIKAKILSVNLNGAARLTSADVCSCELQFNMTGGSSSEISGKNDAVSAELSGAAKLNLSGDGRTLTVTAAGGSSLRAKYFNVKEGSFNLSGAASVETNVSEKLNAETLGGSVLDYYGHPMVVITKTDRVRAH